LEVQSWVKGTMRIVGPTEGKKVAEDEGRNLHQKGGEKRGKSGAGFRTGNIVAEKWKGKKIDRRLENCQQFGHRDKKKGGGGVGFCLKDHQEGGSCSEEC